MSPFVQVRYRGFVASPELRQAVHDQALGLARPGVERCVVCVERWHRHHGLGSYYRVTVEADAAGETLRLADESEDTTAPEALEQILRSVLADARAEIARALDKARAPKALKHSSQARRMHALHGLSTEDEIAFKEPARGWE